MEIKKVKRGEKSEWLELRKKYIGGADAAAVCGLNEFLSPFSLWAEKRGIVPPPEENERMRVGSYLEDYVAKRFEEVTGKKVQRSNFTYFNSEFPWGCADVDRLIPKEDAILECKVVNELALKHYENGDYPPRFYTQIMHYLGILNKKVGYLAVLIGTGRDFRWFTIERDEKEIEALMRVEKKFYGYMQSGEEPPANPVDVDSIELAHPESNGTSIELFGTQNIMRDYLELKSRIAALEQEADGIAAVLKQDMGDAEKGTDGQYICTWANRTKTTFDKKAFQKDNPKIDLSPWEKTTKYRAFSIKKLEV